MSLFFLVFFRSVYRKLSHQKSLNRKTSSTLHSSQFNFQRYQILGSLSKPTIVFDVEGALLKSSTLFPYFMLVAFEAGGLLRALVLFLMYPFVCLVSRDRGIKMMVMVCFFGLKKDNFRVGRAVLPKYFMEDVGLEGFQLLMRGGRKVGVSDFPGVMVEGFLKEHLQVDVVIGRELKVFRGYYVGLMEDHKNSLYNSDQILSSSGTDVIGIGSFCKPLHHLFSLCKDIKTQCIKHHLPRIIVKKGCPLRLQSHNTIRSALSISCYRQTVSCSDIQSEQTIRALSADKNVRLTRDREVDAKKIDELLSKGDLVIYPEGTTCREPYLLRFSPLFAEMGDEIVPVAINSYATMFHDTTASGLKCLDPLFYLMNPFPTYHVQLLKPVSGTSRCHDDDSGEARVKIANHVQQEIGKALGFECTKLTRRDKYLALAGNEGVVKASS
ncbi:amino-acid N-acetyltransferase [Ranunculus cassubicifolius]